MQLLLARGFWINNCVPRRIQSSAKRKRESFNNWRTELRKQNLQTKCSNLENGINNMNAKYIYLLTPWSTVLLEKLTGLQLAKKFPKFYGTRRFITAVTNARNLSLSWASSIQSIPPTSHFLKIHLNIILPSMPKSPKWSLSLRFPHQNPLYGSPPYTRCMLRPSHSSRFYHQNIIGWVVQNIKLLIM